MSTSRKRPSDLVSTYSNSSQLSEFFSDKIGIYSILSYASGNTIYDGTTSAASALSSAVADAEVNGGIIMLPSTTNGGTYLIDDNVTIPSNVTLWKAEGSKLKVASGYTLTSNCEIMGDSSELFDVTLGGTVAGDYYFLDTNSDTSNMIWEPPTQESTELGSTPTIGGESITIPASGWSSSEDAIDTMWEPLRTNHSNYVTRELLGKDESNTHNIYKYIFTPEGGYEKTIILSACTHGNEYTGYYQLWQFMKLLCEDWYKERPLWYLRNNVRIIVIPLVNPWGFVEGRRQNVNGVDLNRQSSYNWDRFSSSDLLSGISVSAYNSSTKTVTVAPDPGYGTNDYRRTKLVVTSGTGSGTSSYIVSNTSNEIVIEDDLGLDNTSVFKVLSKYYKGSSAFSETESQYVKSVVDEYSNATVYLDLHTQISVDAHYIIYTPRFANSPNESIRRIIEEKLLSTERISWATSTLPTLSNYAAVTYYMFSGNPEHHNGLFGSTRDSDEMTRIMWFFGNLILEFSKQEGNALNKIPQEPRMKYYSLNGIDDKNYFLKQASTDEIRCVRWSGDRTKVYALNKTDQTIYQYNCSRAGDINSATYASKSLDVSAQTGEFAQGFDIDPDGVFLVVVSSTNSKVYQYDLSTPDDISTGVYSATDDLDVSVQTGGLEVDVCIDEDCSKLFVLDNDSVTTIIYQYNLSTPKDLSSASYSNKSLSATSIEYEARGICVDKSTGGANYLYLVGNDSVVESGKTVTSYNSKTLTVTGENWSTNRFVGATLVVTSGTGFGTSSEILSNTDETITLEDDLGLDATSVFRISDKVIRRYDFAAQDGDVDGCTLDANYYRVNNLGVTARTIDVHPDGKDITYLASTRNCAYQINMSKTYAVEDYTSSTKKVKVFNTKFTSDELIGDTLEVIQGKGIGLSSVITDNTTTTITLTDNLSIDETSRFKLSTGYYSLNQLTDKYGAKNLSNEYVFVSDSGAHASSFSTIREFQTQNPSIINANGTMTIKSDVDCEIDVYTYLYQPYSPEFSWNRSKYSRIDFFKKRYKLTANQDTIISVDAQLHSAPTCQGMTDTQYGVKKAQNIKTRIRFSSPHGVDIGLLVRNFNIQILIIPSDLGFALEIYESEGRVRESTDEINALGESGFIQYPDSDKFNINNYEDGDGGTDEIETPDTDDSTD